MCIGPGFLYRWEDHNHGLEHKCGTCATVLSSPRAKKTCFGIHEEVCIRYHKTMFYVGQSHHCDACHKCIELHDKRHREIANLLQNIKDHDGVGSTGGPLHDNRKKDRKKESNEDRQDERPIQKDLMEETWDDESTLVEELPQDVRERNQQWNADHRKAAKAERKAAKNQTRFNVITKDDLDRVQDALHQEVDEAKAMATQVPNGQGLLENSIIDNNIAFNTHTFMYSSLRQGIHEKKVAKNNDPKNLAPRTVEEDNAILDPILETLGVCSNLAKSTRERKTVDGKLRTAILEDLEAFVNEQAETMKRMAGYWRYVNRRTYNQMVRNNEVWDWATGAKLPEIEEEIEFGVIEEGHESEEGLLEDETLTSSPPGHTIAGNDNTDESSLQADAASCSLSYHSFGQSADLTTPFTEGGFSSIFSGLDLESGLNRSMESPLSSPESNGSSPQGTVTGRRSSIFKPKREAPPPPVRSGNISPFDGIKDDRVFEQDKHGLAHEASPVRDIHRPRGSVKRPLRGSLATIPPSSSNIFANLNPNLPAPNDEKKVRDRAPGKAPTLTLHVSQSPAAPEAEPGWTLKGAAKKAYPPLPKTPA